MDAALFRSLTPLLDIAGVPLAVLIIAVMVKRGWFFLAREFKALELERDRAWDEVVRIRKSAFDREKRLQERYEQREKVLEGRCERYLRIIETEFQGIRAEAEETP